MKRFVILLFAVLLLLCACKPDTTPTGYPSGEVQQAQVMLNGTIYYYFATGFDEALPGTYTLAGSIQTVDNDAPPTENLCGSRVDVGQEVYVDTATPDTIYVKYENGFARFSTKN